MRIGEWGDGSYYPLELPPDIYQWPIYLLGEPGMGKSTLLANLALQLNTLGEGVVVIDHKDGQLSRDIVERADPNKLVYVSPGQCFFDGHPHHWGLNILEVTKRDRLGFATTRANVMSMFVRMERADFAIMQQMRLYLDSAIALALYSPTATLVDVRRILTEQPYRQGMLANPHVPQEIRDTFTRFDDPKQFTAYARANAVNSSIARLKEILNDPQLYYMVSQPRTTIRLKEWLDAGKLVVFDVAEGLSHNNANLLGNLLLALFMNEAMNRSVRETSRVWRLVADEFDQLAGDNFTELIQKARARKVVPIMAHQSLSQLYRADDPTLYSAATSSPVKLTFRVSPSDAPQVSWIRGEAKASQTESSMPYLPAPAMAEIPASITPMAWRLIVW